MSRDNPINDQISIQVVLSKARITIESKGLKAIVAVSATTLVLGVAILWAVMY